jgi:glycosyltransferase involved in cell wall biosynthesis
MTGQLTGPAVTVCVPTYNYARFLPFAIESVLSQSFEDLELLVLDNASTDDTATVMAQYKDSRLIYIRNERNLGFVGNVNLGLERARGKFLAYLCSDDVWLPDSLRLRAETLEGIDSVGLVHTAERWIDKDGRTIGGSRGRYTSRATGDVAFREFLTRGWRFAFSSCLLRTELLREIGGFREEFGYIADSGMFLDMCLKGGISYLREQLISYRFHGGSLTDEILNGGKIFRDQHEMLKAFLGVDGLAGDYPGIIYRDAKRALAFDVARVAHISRLEGRRKQVVDDFKFACDLYPRILFSPEVLLREALSFTLPAWVLRALRRAKGAAWGNGQGLR